jgi:hypothetical protein
MAKKFPKIPQDRYYTPFRPVVPLIPHIKHIDSYAEPCEGKRDLIRHLHYFGKACSYSNDLDHGVDARTDPALAGAKAIITNPPYTWAVLSVMIERFMSIGETWLLLELAFLSNAQAAPYLRHCSDVVPVGRIKWFADSKFESAKDYAWFRFHRDHTSYPTVHPRVLVPRGIHIPADHARMTLLTQGTR